MRKSKKSKPFINKYNWEGIIYQSERDDWKILEKNNITIALNKVYANNNNNNNNNNNINNIYIYIYIYIYI